MLKNAQVSVLLTQERFNPRYNIENRRRRFSIPNPRSSNQDGLLGTVWETLAQESKQNPSSEVKSENLAYVIYTSGSSGTAKGSDDLAPRYLQSYVVDANRLSNE